MPNLRILMKNINAYLTFNGNCREAMHFYRDCLGGELALQAISDSPMAGKLPVTMQQHILHGSLTCGAITLLASDMVGEKGLTKGNNISLMLDCSSEDEIRTLFDKLLQGGRIVHQLEHTFWGGMIGDLTDKFGNQWLLHYANIKQH